MRYSFLLLFFLLFTAKAAFPQQTIILGTVRDVGNRPLPSVVVTIPGQPDGVNTETDGTYNLTTTGPGTSISFTYLGYKTIYRSIVPGKTQYINVRMQANSTSLSEVVVSAKRGKKYSNKQNPAVELIRKVIENKARNRPDSYNFVQYAKYERIKFSLTDLSSRLTGSRSFRKFQFLLQPSDTTRPDDKSVLPVFMQEQISRNYYRKDPRKKVELITAKKAVDFGQYMDQNGLSSYLNRLYADIDIYSTNIFIVTNEFLSPVADLAPTFYEYFITDTITSETGEKLVELSFIPRNQADLLFTGKLYIGLDGNYAVEKASLQLSKSANLNWVRDLHIDLGFSRNDDGRYHLSRSTMAVNFGVLKKKGLSIFGERTISISDYRTNQPAAAAVYSGAGARSLPQDSLEADKNWAGIRPDTLSTADARIYANIDSLKTIPSFKRKIGIASVLTSGFLPAGKFEIGAIGGFYSFNQLEGSRIRFGGRTTTALSNRIYFEGYGAYGFKDQKWKYLLSSTYAFNHKSIYTFPLHYIQLSYRNDVEIPGQNLAGGQNDNLLFSFKRRVNDEFLYTKTFRISYVQEFAGHFSYILGFRHWQQQPAGSLNYFTLQNGLPVPAPDPQTSEFSLGVRYAPHEQIFQGKINRTTVPSRYPILKAAFTTSVKGLFGDEYAYHSLDFSIYKRFYLSQLGFTDITLRTFRTWGQAPYPLLTLHNANESYSYQQYSYNLMNFMEFVSDHYTSVNIEQNFNGFFLNKLPLIQKLKLKEILGLKVLSGGLSEQNNPARHPSLIQFQVNNLGQPLTYALSSRPYIEGNIGIGNIFNVLRVDLVRRFTYRHNPDVTQLGIRFSMNFDF